MEFDALKEKALSLPLQPGVYIMRDKDDRVIYVGKAKKLKNRVSQYFHDTASHNAKTRIMVSKIDHFEVIVAASEFEALVLECSLIKQHMPRYNILLKDDKGYPYLRLDMKEEYPKITVVGRPENDGAGYYGPYGGRAVTHSVLETINAVFKLPACSKKFPRDIGKTRPCLHYHMNQCQGWCQKECKEEYRQNIEFARQLLMGNYKKISTEIHNQMLAAADDLNFELAAILRDRLNAVEALGQKQLVTAGKIADTDIIGFASTESRSCFTVLHYSSGNLLDKDYEIMSAQDDAQSCVNSLLKQYYINRGLLPKVILLPFDIEDRDLIAQFLEQKFGRKPKFIIPQRGDNVKLIELANKNAMEEATRVTTKEERTKSILGLLGKMLSIPTPVRIESFDISNISGTDIVASMVVFLDGKPYKKDYKRFKIKGLDNQDDYHSMHQVISRRFQRYIDGDEGFQELPDILLIDGGVTHAETACKALQALGLNIPTYGMVKDDRHRTRSLVTPDGMEVGVERFPAVFSFIGTIQEETHRFAITFHRELRSKRLRYSQLDQIEGIGPKRKQDLLRRFKSITAIKNASVEELCSVLPKDTARAVFAFFNGENKE